MKNLVIIVISLLLSSCSNSIIDDSSSNDDPEKWAIPFADIDNKPANFNRIIPIDKPVFKLASQFSNIADGEELFAIKENGVVKVYFVQSLHHTEIVNDAIGDTRFSITYCPLTGSGICFDRSNLGKDNTLGISGLLYNDNLMPYDRKTGSIFSQMLGSSVNGEFINLKLKKIMLLRANWKFIRMYHPEALVMTNNFDAGLSSDGDDNDYHFGVLDKFGVKVYTVDTNNHNSEFIDSGVLLLNQFSLITSFNYQYEIDKILPLDKYPNVVVDSQLNFIDAFGYINEGPNKGDRIAWDESYLAKDWAFQLFFDQVEYYQ
jgi:hypothetical protein